MFNCQEEYGYESIASTSGLGTCTGTLAPRNPSPRNLNITRTNLCIWGRFEIVLDQYSTLLLNGGTSGRRCHFSLRTARTSERGAVAACGRETCTHMPTYIHTLHAIIQSSPKIKVAPKRRLQNRGQFDRQTAEKGSPPIILPERYV